MKKILNGLLLALFALYAVCVICLCEAMGLTMEVE